MSDLYSKKKGGGERGNSGIPGTLPWVRPLMEYSGSTLYCCEAFVDILDLMILVFFSPKNLCCFLFNGSGLIDQTSTEVQLIPTLRTLIG